MNRLDKYGYYNEVLDLVRDNLHNTTNPLLGTTNFEEWRKELDILSPFQKIKVLVGLQSAMSMFWSPWLSRITETGTEIIKTERYYSAKVRPDANHGDQDVSKPIVRSIMIPASSYSTVCRFDAKTLKTNPMQVVDEILKENAGAFQKFYVESALSTLLTKPESQDPHVGCWYRDTSKFPANQRVVPYPNGLKVFDASESHYLVHETVTTDIFEILKDKIQSKGYGKGQIVYFANEKFWRRMRDLRESGLDYGKSAWTPEILTLFQLGDANFLKSKGNMVFVDVPSWLFPDGYVLTLDLSEQVLYKRESNHPELRGVQVLTSSMDSMISEKEVKTGEQEIGWAIQNRGAGAVMLINDIAGLSQGNTEYVNPVIELA